MLTQLPVRLQPSTIARPLSARVRAKSQARYAKRRHSVMPVVRGCPRGAPARKREKSHGHAPREPAREGCVEIGSRGAPFATGAAEMRERTTRERPRAGAPAGKAVACSMPLAARLPSIRESPPTVQKLAANVAASLCMITTAEVGGALQ